MQNLLNKQCKRVYSVAPIKTCSLKSISRHLYLFILPIADKADKKAEIEKTERERQLQQEREEEMRELSIKLRRR